MYNNYDAIILSALLTNVSMVF